MGVQKYCEILRRRRLAPSAFSLTLDCGGIAERASAGQFIHIKCGGEFLLRRPISICDIDGTRLEIVFETRGAGTLWLSRRSEGEVLDVLGPLGHGFDTSGGKILLAGGGIGAAPLLCAAKMAEGRASAILGFRSSDRVILKDRYESLCEKVDITTDDGSFGKQGFVSDTLRLRLSEDSTCRVLACGPRPMLKAVAAVCDEFHVPCEVSLEERMGCGVGACLVCACKVRSLDGGRYAHVCKDGPVFNAGEVEWDD